MSQVESPSVERLVGVAEELVQSRRVVQSETIARNRKQLGDKVAKGLEDQFRTEESDNGR